MAVGGRNFAYKQEANLSTTYNGYGGDRAVDGNKHSNFDSKSCAHSDINEDSPILTVTLLQPALIHRVALYNRECPAGKWGWTCTNNCPEHCSRYCHIDDGTCNVSCVGSNDPPECATEFPPESNTSITGVIVLVLLVAVLLLLAAFIIFFRRNKLPNVNDIFAKWTHRRPYEHDEQKEDNYFEDNEAMG
ncbi:hypothetical protein Btru_033705, partial [Bulinus truncatus]